MRILTLHLKRKWFDQIKLGEKKEEYRSQTCYWIKRFLTCDEHFLEFDRIRFVLGYPNLTDEERILEFKNPKIRIGTGRPEWGAIPGVNYFVITWEK